MNSLVVKTFFGLGSVAVVPLSSSFIFKKIEVDSSLGGGGLKANQQETIFAETKGSGDPMKKAMEMIDDGKQTAITKSTKGCFWLSDQGRIKLFVCVNGLESEGPLFLFRYDWQSKENSIKKVVKISQKNGNTNSLPTLMQFEKEGSEDLPREAKTSLASLWNDWKGSEFSTSHCKLTQDGGGSLKYTLKCENPKKQPPTWTKQVSKNDMTLSDNSSHLKK